jgi:polar amino acid transport system substrate-binding protein
VSIGERSAILQNTWLAEEKTKLGRKQDFPLQKSEREQNMPALNISLRRIGMHLAAIVIGATLAYPAAAASTLERVKEQGYLRMGFANETPFSYATPEGALAGVDVDILNNILKKMGINEIDGGLTTFGSLIPGLQAGRFDLVSSAIYIRPDRCAQVSFVEPLYILGDTIIVPAGNPKKIHSYKDVAANPDLKIGYPTGGTGIMGNAEAMGVKPEQMIGFPDGPSGFEAVKAGRIDGYATTSMVGQTQLNTLNDPALARADPFEQPVVDGKIMFGIASFAVRKDDADLLAELNKHLLEMRGKPEYMEILAKYGMTEADLPSPEMTTAKICQGN